VLALGNLRKTFTVGRAGRTVTAVQDLTLSIQKGEVLGLVGESGSGKTTVARLVAQLYPRSGGTMRLAGRDVPAGLSGKGLRRLRRDVQVIFQDPFSSLNALHTIGYILSRPLRVHGLARRSEVDARVVQLLERVGLTPGAEYARKRPHELSGGQRQRVGIARALAVQPQLILADEPTSMLDVSIRLDIMNLLLDLRERDGLSFLFITHDLAGARYMCDRIAVMYAGHLVELGPAGRVIEDPQHPYTRLLRSAAPKPEAGLAPERVEARGEVPDLAHLPPGCPFEPRCPLARPECRAGVPALVEIEPGHHSRCVLRGGGAVASASRDT
jgi:peptide/nickel transport system ATP-binding protein